MSKDVADGTGGPELLVLGHPCIDRARRGGAVECTLGGSAAYAVQVAKLAGAAVAWVAGAVPNDPRMAPLQRNIEAHMRFLTHLPQYHVQWDKLLSRRRERVTHLPAPPLLPNEVPARWHQCPVALVAPTLDECPGSLTSTLRNRLVVVGAQGWLRRLDANGWVIFAASPEFITPPGNVHAMAFSQDDHPDAYGEARRLASLGLWVVVTAAAAGGTVFPPHGEPPRPYKAASAQLVDPTGAGDTFVTLFALALARGFSSCEAAEFGAQAAARVVEGVGLGTLQQMPVCLPARRYPLPLAAADEGLYAPEH